MSILGIIALVIAFCVAFWVCRTLVTANWKTLAYCIWALILILVCLWVVGVFPSDLLSTRVVRHG